MQKKLTNIFRVSPENIFNYKQNHPELVIKDLKEFNIPESIQSIVRQSMLCRGINKWLKVRRDLIAYKKQIKHIIKDYQKSIPLLKKLMSMYYCNIKDVANKNISIGNYYYYRDLERQYLIDKEVLKVYEKRQKTDTNLLEKLYGDFPIYRALPLLMMLYMA